MTLDDWLTTPARYARAARHIHDTSGRYAKRDAVGEVCDVDTANGYVVVNFPATGPILCNPDEILPAPNAR